MRVNPLFFHIRATMHFCFLIIHFVEKKNRGGDDDDTYLVG